MAQLPLGAAEALWTATPCCVPPLDIYVEFYTAGMFRPHFGLTAQLRSGPLGKVETVLYSLGTYNPDTGSVLGRLERIYLPREVLRWRETKVLRGRMAEYALSPSKRVHRIGEQA